MRCMPLARGAFRMMLFIIGFVYIKKEGSHDPAARVLVANHTTWTDAILIMWLCMSYPVSRVENVSVPIFGSIILLFDAIIVDRRSKDSRAATLAEIKFRAENPDKWPHPTLIFPEGTCTSQRSVILFQQGVFTLDTVVQGVSVQYDTHSGLDLSWCWGTSTITWVQMLATPVISATVRFLDVQKGCEETRKAIAESIGAETTTHTTKDVLLMKQAAYYGFDHQPDFAIDTGALRSAFPHLHTSYTHLLLNVWCKTKRPFSLARWAQAIFPGQDRLHSIVSNLYKLPSAAAPLTFHTFVWLSFKVLSVLEGQHEEDSSCDWHSRARRLEETEVRNPPVQTVPVTDVEEGILSPSILIWSEVLRRLPPR
eukprot:TRINITY_DN23749_c0_g1_i1.p1 TRINITY_DN23749_c0_g1~~TRINITY_DN23749_c0_g1_i1.p1  ORF type:complete len:423 (+),score=108.31 TRINITY_DN23749_c0_g1_i1:166-1269(+)